MAASHDEHTKLHLSWWIATAQQPPPPTHHHLDEPHFWAELHAPLLVLGTLKLKVAGAVNAAAHRTQQQQQQQQQQQDIVQE